MHTTHRRLPPRSRLFDLRQRRPSHIRLALALRILLHIREVDRGHEVAGLPCIRDFGIELVDLFEGQTFGFVDAEIDEGDADDALWMFSSCAWRWVR